MATYRRNIGKQNAYDGLKAEHIFQTSENIKQKLQLYFQKQIQSIVPANSIRKYDSIINFEDGTKIKIQNKKIKNYHGFGNSFDRRHVCNTFNNQFLRKYLVLLTLVRTTPTRTKMTSNQKKDFKKLCDNNFNDIKQYVRSALIGEGEHSNEYFVIMKTDNFSNIKIFIIKSEKLFDIITKPMNTYISLRTNGTCLHIGRYMSIQRKGSKRDRSPNDIQAKLRFKKQLIKRCTKLRDTKFKNLYPELINLICTNLENTDAANLMMTSKNNLKYLKYQMNTRLVNTSKIMDFIYIDKNIIFKKDKVVEIMKNLPPSCISKKLIIDYKLVDIEQGYVVHMITLDEKVKNMEDNFTLNNLIKWIRLLENNDEFYYDMWPDYNNLWKPYNKNDSFSYRNNFESFKFTR